MKNLRFKAGASALRHIREHGLRRDDIKVMAGASGAAKWLTLSHLDRLIFGEWFKDRQEPLFTVGSSVGSWRFAMAAQDDPVSAITEFEHRYINQRYDEKPTPADITAVVDGMMGDHFDPVAAVNHPWLRQNILAVRARGLLATEQKIPLAAGLGCAALANLVDRKSLRLFFERILFSDPRDKPPFFELANFPTKQISLTAQNLRQALLASGSIPLLMDGVRNVPGAPDGIYWDGGIMDYHLDIPYGLAPSEIVLFPHFYDYLIPGWMDKKLPWRRAQAANVDNVLLVSPTAEFVSTFPHGKIPDRRDFVSFHKRDEERLAYWNKVVDLCRPLADEFWDAVHSNTIKERISPL